MASRAHGPSRGDRPSSSSTVLCIVLLIMATVAATIGAAGIPLRRLMAAAGLTAGDPALIERDRLVLWSIRLPRIAMACMIGAMLAAAGTMHAGPVPQSAGRARPGRRIRRRGARRRSHHRARRPHSRRHRHRAAVRGSADRRVLRRAADHRGALPRRDPRRPHLDRHVAAGRPCDRRAGAGRDRPARSSWRTTASSATSRSGRSARSAARPGGRPPPSRRSCSCCCCRCRSSPTAWT